MTSNDVTMTEEMALDQLEAWFGANGLVVPQPVKLRAPRPSPSDDEPPRSDFADPGSEGADGDWEDDSAPEHQTGDDRRRRELRAQYEAVARMLVPMIKTGQLVVDGDLLRYRPFARQWERDPLVIEEPDGEMLAVLSKDGAPMMVKVARAFAGRLGVGVNKMKVLRARDFETLSVILGLWNTFRV